MQVFHIEKMLVEVKMERFAYVLERYSERKEEPRTSTVMSTKNASAVRQSEFGALSIPILATLTTSAFSAAHVHSVSFCRPFPEKRRDQTYWLVPNGIHERQAPEQSKKLVETDSARIL